jgi:hypothetical protein
VWRIAVVNDFDNSKSFIDSRKYGIMTTTEGSRVSAAHRGYTKKEDTIRVYIKSKLALETRNREEANGFIGNAIQKVPKPLRQEFECLHEDYLKL